MKRFQQNKITRSDAIIFTRQLSTLLHSGISISQALSTLSEETNNEKFKNVLKDIHRFITSGESLSRAISRYPALFSELFIHMVEVGETGGLLPEVLDRVAILYAKEMAIKSKIKSAMIYPCVLIIMAFLVVNFVLIGVLPKFVAVFEASQAALPLPTRIILFFSSITRKLWFSFLAMLALCVFLFKAHIREPQGRYQFHSWLLKVPLFGEIYKKIIITQFSHTLSALLASGIPLLKGLSVVEKTLPNVVVQGIVQEMRQAMSQGKPLTQSFKDSAFFSPMVVQMVSTGEKSGKLDDMLNEVTSFYEPEIENTINNLTTLLEPVMLLAMGIMVAFIALSVLLPIFNLIKVFRV